MKVTIDRSELGKGYGITSKASLEAVELTRDEGVQIEPIYTGKAMAAMRKDLQKGIEGPVLFWNTMRGPIKAEEDGWRDKLPNWVKKKLVQHVAQ